jgi:predicted acyl esterase
VRRATTVLLTGLLTAGGVAALTPSAASAAAAATPPEPLTITVTHLGPEDRTCHIDADLYVPPSATAATPAPAVLTTNGFGGDKTDQAALAGSLESAGYVVLAYTGLGFIDHDNCPITLDDRAHDGAAASQLLRFLGGDTTVHAEDEATHRTVTVDQVQTQATTLPHDPVVGMVGLSYGGEVQFATAAYEQETYGATRLDALNPQITWNDLSYSLDPNNQLPDTTAANGSVSSNDPGSFKYQWSLFFTGEGIADGVADVASVNSTTTFANYVENNCANFSSQVCVALGEVAAQGYPSQTSIAFLRNASVASYLADVKVPTMLWQGEADTLFNLQESVATYTGLAKQGTPVALQWQSWGHSHMSPAPGEYDQGDLAGTYEGQQLLAWLGHWLEHDSSTAQSGFSYFRDWAHPATGGTEADAAAAYATAPSPTAVASPRTFYLSGSDRGGATLPVGGCHPTTTTCASTSTGGGSLVPDRRSITPGTSGWSSTAPIGPNYSETSAVESMLTPEPPPTDPPGTSVRFLTAPFTTATDVVGSARLTVRLTSPVVAATQKQGPGGQLVVYAKLYDVGPGGTPVELPHRLISPTRVSDTTKPVTIELPGIAHRFAPGHRLAIVLAGGDDAYRGSTTPQPVVLVTGNKEQQLVVPFLR